MGKLEKLFGVKKPVIGMIHMGGMHQRDRMDIALEEMRVYEKEGVSGAIIEDYHCGILDELIEVAAAIKKEKFNVIAGFNVLQNPSLSVMLSDGYGGKFVQYDSVWEKENWQTFGQFILGGVGFKYQPVTGNSLEYDLVEGMKRCDAIVTTGSGTGIETPVQKLKEYKKIMGDFPLIVGAGVNPDNAYEQSQIADGCIVGSCFKRGGDTRLMVDDILVREFMEKWRGS